MEKVKELKLGYKKELTKNELVNAEDVNLEEVKEDEEVLNSLESKKESTKEKNERELREKYYDKAVEIIEKTGIKTFSNLEKKLKIGTRQAKRLLEMLKEDGIIINEEKQKQNEKILEEVKKERENSYLQEKEQSIEEEEKEEPRAILKSDEIEKSLTLEDINKQIKNLEDEIEDNKWSPIFWKKKERKNKLENLQYQKKELEEILLDKKEKPLLYYAFEKSSNQLVLNRFRGIYTNVIDLRDLKKDWDELESKYINWIDENEGFFNFNIYGFVKVIKNVEELRDKDRKIDPSSDKAIYKIVGPDGEIIADDIQGYNEAAKIYNEKTEEYKNKLEEEYEKEKVKEDIVPENDEKPEKIEEGRESEEEKKKNQEEKEKREAQEMAYWESRKKMFEGKTPEEIRDILIREVELRKEIEIENGPLSERIKNGISKGIEAWDNWGNKKGTLGLSIRLGKMAASLALIGLTASFSVEKLASIVGTAGALSGGVTTYMGKKLLFGLGFGAVMEGFNNLSPGKRKAIQIMMMVGSAGLAIGTGGIFAGAAVGGSAAFGYGLSKLVQGRFSEEKIKERMNKIKTDNPIDLTKLQETSEKFQKEYLEALKKAENTRLKRKLAGGLAAIVGSIVVLESSGFVHDLDDAKIQSEINQDVDKILEEDLQKSGQSGEEAINKEIEDILKKEEETLTKEINNPITEDQIDLNKEIDKTLQEDLTRIEKQGEEVINKDIENKTDLDKTITEVKNPETKIIFAEADGGQGAISTLRELQQNLAKEYENVEKLPSSVDHIINTDAHDLAKEYGLYRPEEEAESAKVFVGDKITFDKETGEVTFHHVRGGEDILQKGVEYKGDMFDAGRGSNIEVSTVDEAKIEDLDTGENNAVTNDEISSEFLKNNPQVSPFANSEDITQDFRVPTENQEIPRNENIEVDSKSANDINNEEVNSSNKEEEFKQQSETNKEELTPREIRKVERVFDKNLDHLFPKKQDMKIWDEVKNQSASDIYYGESFNNLDVKYESLNSYLHQINKVTGIEPIEGNWIRSAETNIDFIKRGIKEAALLGKLDEIKL